MAKYITAINQYTFDPDELRMLTQAKIIHYSHQASFHKTFVFQQRTYQPCRARAFAGGGHMRPHRAKMAKMSDELLEMLMCLRCNGN